VDNPKRETGSYGSGGRAPGVPDEVVDWGLPRPLSDNTAGIANCYMHVTRVVEET
jgi:hypothetical protein